MEKNKIAVNKGILKRAYGTNFDLNLQKRIQYLVLLRNDIHRFRAQLRCIYRTAEKLE